MLGKTEWAIGDGFMSETSCGGYDSHEAVCVLNLSDKPAAIAITVYFEDSEPLTGFTAHCGAARTNHIRLDKIKNADGVQIPKEKPYALLVQSDVPIVVQHSRMDVTQAEMTLMSTIAYTTNG